MDLHRFKSRQKVRLAYQLATATFLLRAYTLQILLEERANFNPDQPRVPRGNRYGGRWTKPGVDWGSPAAESRPRFIPISHEIEPPKVPAERPGTAAERNMIARQIARYLKGFPPIRRAVFLARLAWVINEAGHTIQSYFDEPKTLSELRRNALQPRPGYDIHHIVEQTSARRDGFPDWQIESDVNKVLIPRYLHWEITAWYSKKDEEFGGLSPREYLRGKSWEERERIGLMALQRFGVLKP